MRIDVNHPIWTESLIERLAARDALPLIRRNCGLTVLHSFVAVWLRAGAVAGAHQPARLARVLDRITAWRVLFVHPGRGLAPRQVEAEIGGTPWWRALTGYVAQVHAAWLAFTTIRRREHPELVVPEPIATGREAMLLTFRADLFARIEVAA